MSAPDRQEIVMLLAAHHNRELTAAETGRLRELAAADPRLEHELREIDAAHELFARERALLAEVSDPVDTAEAADESYQRLCRAAASSEMQLRSKLLHGGAADLSAASSGRRHVRIALGAAAALLVVGAVLWSVLGGADRPELLRRSPDGGVLGAPAKILIEAELVRSRPELSWHSVIGASRYDAVIEDADGRALLRRPDDAARSNHWLLTADQFDDLYRRSGLVLRITARDGAGTIVGSSGDLPLRLVD